jgi:hypothetical protein
MLHRYSFSPIIHCPSLCPYSPPRALFLDEYDPDREDAAWKFCTEHCWLTSESERPCLIEFARRRARAEKGEPAEEPTARRDPASVHPTH